MRNANQLGRLSFTLGISALTCSLSAQAGERYIVSLKSPSAFSNVRLSLREALRKEFFTRDAMGNRKLVYPKLLSTDFEIIGAMENLNLVVVNAESLDADDLADLEANADVEYVEKDFYIPLPETLRLGAGTGTESVTAESPELTWGVKAIRAPEAWGNHTSALSEPSRIARVLVLDTGIDRNHPDLKNRFEEGKDFVRGLSEMDLIPGNLFGLNALTRDPIEGSAADDKDDFSDEIGHGTHVSGTIAAELDNSGVAGVAPYARLLMGRVCGRFGCGSSAIVNGINWGITKKVDVISMSLGGPTNSRAQKEALDKAAAAGVINVAASGNDGTALISFPAAYGSVIAVGAVKPDLKRAEFSQYGPELAVVAPGVDVLSTVPLGSGRESVVKVTLNGQSTLVASSAFAGAQEAITPLRAKLVYAGLGKQEDFDKVNVKGVIALVSRGEITFADKVKFAIKAGAAGVLVFNNAPGLISGGLTTDGSLVAIPLCMVEQTVGESLRNSLAAGNMDEAILQTLRTDFASYQGTSMATPHVAGVVALVKAANPALKQAQVAAILKKTATPASPAENSKNEYGSGLVNAEAAVAEAIRLRTSLNDLN